MSHRDMTITTLTTTSNTFYIQDLNFPFSSGHSHEHAGQVKRNADNINSGVRLVYYVSSLICFLTPGGCLCEGVVVPAALCGA